MYKRQMEAAKRYAERTLHSIQANLGEEKDDTLNSALTNRFIKDGLFSGNPMQMLTQSDEEVLAKARSERRRQEIMNALDLDGRHSAFVDAGIECTVTCKTLPDAFQLSPEEVLRGGMALITDPQNNQMFIQEGRELGKCVRFDANSPGMIGEGSCAEFIHGFFRRVRVVVPGGSDDTISIANLAFP